MANKFNYKDKTFSVGDTLNVSLRVPEGDKFRIQNFTGLLIAIKGREAGKTFTVRKIAANSIGVERIIPVQSPEIDDITLKAAGHTRRSKLYYLRDRVGRSALRVKTPKAKAIAQKNA